MSASDSFDTHGITGMTDDQVAARLREEGRNELPSTQRRSSLAIALEVVREPMFLLLVACGAVYLLVGDVGEALMLLGFVVVVIGITFIQERRTERALDALRDLASPRALVIRNGEQQRIAGRDVVRGDMVIVVEGDRIPADAVLRRATNLSVDESLLTGESLPVHKSATSGSPPSTQPGGDDLPFVYSGTLVTAGQGLVEVTATGIRSEIGKIGKSLQGVETEGTLLQQQTGRLVRKLAVVGLLLCLLVVVVYGVTRGNDWPAWHQGLLAGIAMAMAMLPEELPVVLTIFLALGAWRISQNHVLTRRIPAIETLGAATVLCVDKTGTLTQNRMSVSRLFAGGRSFDCTRASEQALPEELHGLLEFGVLASRQDPFDPMEKALKECGEQYLGGTEHIHANWTLVREYPLSTELLALSHVWRASGDGALTVATKGAPEAIGDLCHFTAEQLRELSTTVAAMADDGLRVLGVARGRVPDAALPADQHDVEFEFLGLVGLADPIREAVPAAIGECHAAGVRVIMITGDYPGTAQNIARQIGLGDIGQVITGAELNKMSDGELAGRIRKARIFARVVPEQKLRIVNALKANGEVVAMTGDGVNDAPALKAAHIGIAMGGRGTDVAREAASLVLLDDDFTSIVHAVRLGRRIYDNIKKAMSYVFAIHVPIAGLSLIPVFIPGWPLILLPVHIVFLELIIDPACSLVFEAEAAERNVMNRPPRSPKDKLFSLKSVGVSLLQGFSVLAAVLGTYVLARSLGHTLDNARGLTFATLVTANLALILTNRSWSRTIISMFKEPNAAMKWVLLMAAASLVFVLNVPWLRTLFRFDPLHWIDVVICLGVGAVSIAWFEGIKVIAARRSRASGR